MAFVYFLFMANKYMWGGFGCVNEVFSARGWKIDVCVWCCCRFVWNELSGGRLAVVPTDDATDRKSVFLWTRAFMESWQIPLFVCCCDASLCFGRFWFPLKHWPPLLCHLTLICFIFYINIKSHHPIFPFFSIWELEQKGFLLTMFDT